MEYLSRQYKKNSLKDKYTCWYIDGVGRGGKQLQILLESLPQEAQDRYNNPGTEEELLSDKFSMTQLQEADYKAKVVQDFKASGLSAEKFLEQFNSENDEKIAVRTLYIWQEKFTEGGMQALVDGRGGHNKGACSISDEVWEFFYSLYMTLQKRSIQWCYDKTRMKFPDIPSVSAFKRKVRTIPEYAILRYRVGTKAFTDALPSMIRDKSQVKPNDIWCSDHHRADVFVKNSTGHIIRPLITVFSDICSTKIISFIVREEDPNTTVVKKCLRLGMETYGVPYEIYTDNGKDYKARDLSLEYPLSVMNVLGIGKITATPYHGQAKPIERFFRTLEERFGKMFYSYAGNDAKSVPNIWQRRYRNLKKTRIFRQWISTLNSLKSGLKSITILHITVKEWTGRHLTKYTFRTLKNVLKLKTGTHSNFFVGKLLQERLTETGSEFSVRHTATMTAVWYRITVKKSWLLMTLTTSTVYLYLTWITDISVWRNPDLSLCSATRMRKNSISLQRKRKKCVSW